MEVTNIVCDKCGCSVEEYNGLTGNITPITVDFGYGSRYDGEIWRFDLCDDCLDEIVHPFVEKINTGQTI